LRVKARVKLTLVDEAGEPFMGIGLVWLLDRIRRLHSIRKAASDMDMSYAKAHAIIKRLERGLGRPVVVRRRGGAEKGGAELTAFAERLLDSYARFNDRVSRHVQSEFSALRRSLRSAG
jgi:molybdate transport system regulatory protein